MTVIPALEKLRQNCQFEASLACIGGDPVSKTKQTTKGVYLRGASGYIWGRRNKSSNIYQSFPQDSGSSGYSISIRKILFSETFH
jgi:hypothetical protein